MNHASSCKRFLSSVSFKRYLGLPLRKEADAYKVFNCLNKSQMTMPAVTDTLSECFVPY